MKKILNWLFQDQSLPASQWEVILWWEKRRILFNVLIGIWGILCLFIFYWAIDASGQLPPGEDAVEPISLIFAPVIINICYTLGWMVELVARRVCITLSPRFSRGLLKVGIIFSLAVISIPAIYWSSYCLLRF